MKKLIYLLAFLLTGFAFETQASHVAGGDIRYDCIGQDSFLITVNFYRDCDGISAPTTIPLSVRCTETNNTYNVATQMGYPLPVNTFNAEVSQLCNQVLAQSACQGGNLEGMQAYQVQYIVDLSQFPPEECSNWVFFWSVNARNPSINGSQQTYYVETELNNGGTRDCNNSPYFTALPIPYVCTGQQVNYSFGVGEQDGDSLVYKLDTAYQGFDNSMTYQTGYNPQQPFGAANPVTLDQTTGQLSFVAPALTGGEDNYILVVKVCEFDRNTGEFLGSVTRDIQLVIIDCLGNQVPKSVSGGIQNFSGTGVQNDSNSVTVCFGQSFSFELEFEDLDSNGNISNDSISVTSNIDTILPGATFTVTQGNPVTVTVSWLAQPVNNGFATFNFFVRDNACPVYGISTFTYDIVIIPSTVLGPDTTICVDDTFELNAQGGNTFGWTVIPNPGGGIGDPINVGVNFGCDSCKTPWINPAQTTTYVVESDLDAACGNRDTITITVFDNYDVTISDNSPYCVDELLDSLTAATAGGTFIGAGIANGQAGIFVPGAVDPGFGNDSVVQIIYVLQGSCGNTDTADIVVNGYPDARIATPGPLCVNSTNIQLQGFTTGGVWQGQNVTNAGVIDPSAFTAPDSVWVYHTVDISGCVFTDSSLFGIIDIYNSKIDSLPKICDGDSLLVYLNDYEGDPFGIWQGGNVEELPAGSGEFFFRTQGLRPGKFPITYTIEGSCGSSSTEDLVVSQVPDASIFGADSVYCDNITDSVLLETAREGGIWGGDMNVLHDGNFIPAKVGEGLYSISYELYDRETSCYNKNVVEVRIARTPIKPKLFGGTYCQGHNLNNLRADGLLSNTFKWFEANGEDSVLIGAGNPFNYGELQSMPTVLYGTQVSEYGCESPTERVDITVLPSPLASFTADTFKGNAPLIIDFENTSGPDSMALTFSWEVSDIYQSDDADIFSYTFNEIGRYPVRLTADNSRCTDEVEVLVIVDRIVNMFIPNVFTPNGDGFNDRLEWEVEGIEDFNIKIYNRWGRKVYEKDRAEGFWSGEDQPTGTYYYVITGSEATLDAEPVEWRGDVTLIRD